MPRSHAAAAGGTVALARRATASSWLHDESGRSRFDRRDILRTTLGGQNMEGGSDTMRSLGGKPLVTVMGLRVDEPADDWSWGPAWDTMVMQVCDGYIAESNPDRDGAGYQREGELPADTTAMELTPCQPGEWGRGESDGRCPSRPFPQDVDRAPTDEMVPPTQAIEIRIETAGPDDQALQGDDSSVCTSRVFYMPLAQWCTRQGQEAWYAQHITAVVESRSGYHKLYVTQDIFGRYFLERCNTIRYRYHQLLLFTSRFRQLATAVLHRDEVEQWNTTGRFAMNPVPGATRLWSTLHTSEQELLETVGFVASSWDTGTSLSEDAQVGTV